MSNIGQFIQDAIECSVYLSPRDIGLTAEEIREATKQAGFLRGETNDALASPIIRRDGKRCFPTLLGIRRGLSVDFNFAFSPEYRKWEAFEFVRQELLQLAREVGAAQASLPRDTLVERGVAKGHDRKDVEIAITITVLEDIFQEKNGSISQGHATYALPSQQIAQTGARSPFPRPGIERTYGIVRDIIERRTDGRPAASEPLDAFEACLGTLGHDRFRAWWVQKRHELRLANQTQQPTTVLVMAASLAEGALAFVVPRAQKSGLMGRIDVSKPRQWRFDDLVKGAKSGDPNVEAILDERTSQRALDLNAARQRIHAGYLIDTIPTGPIPDLRPEEARDAVQTVELVVRKIVDWLGRHPTP